MGCVVTIVGFFLIVCFGEFVYGGVGVGIGIIFMLVEYIVGELKNKFTRSKPTTVAKEDDDEKKTSKQTETHNIFLTLPQYSSNTSRLKITENRPRSKKNSHQQIIEELKNNGIEYFYHFTDTRNLDSIRKCGGLISWSSCNEHNINIPSAGGSDFSRELDKRYNLQDYVRLSFCNDHPMAYRLKKEGKKLVLLKISIDVAEWEDTLFSDMNATDTEHSHGGSLAALRKVKFDAVKRNYVSRYDEDFKYHQAEILVKTTIPKEFIVNLNNPETM